MLIGVRGNARSTSFSVGTLKSDGLEALGRAALPGGDAPEPVGLAGQVARVVVRAGLGEPVRGVQSLDLAQRLGLDRAGAVGLAVDRGVVQHHHLVVLGHADVQLQHVRARPHGLLEGVHRVGRELVLAALVGDVQRALLDPAVAVRGARGGRDGQDEHERCEQAAGDAGHRGDASRARAGRASVAEGVAEVLHPAVGGVGPSARLLQSGPRASQAALGLLGDLDRMVDRPLGLAPLPVAPPPPPRRPGGARAPWRRAGRLPRPTRAAPFRFAGRRGGRQRPEPRRLVAER